MNGDKNKKDQRILISACLAGVNCKYDGTNQLHPHLAQLVTTGQAMLVCPEQLGGCPTPRPAVEILGGTGADVLEGNCKVMGKNGEDVTVQFLKGAHEVLHIAKLIHAEKAILKARSPSCGCGRIYDGTFSGVLLEGNGVTTELLKRNGIEVISELDYFKG